MLGYKIAQVRLNNKENKRVLITLEIPNDAKTNINRENIFDPIKAKYRSNKVKVIKIQDENNYEYKEAESMFCLKKIIYIKGRETYERDFHQDLEVVCGEGIHFFLDKEVALNYGLNSVENGIFQSWHDNGQKSIETICKNHKYTEYQEWYENGNQYMKCSFLEGKLNGFHELWYSNGTKKKECYYQNGLLNGQYIEYYSTGKIKLQCMFIKGEKHGIYQEWFFNAGIVFIKCFYSKGKLDGLYQKWNTKGKKILEVHYKDNIKQI